jgi:succinate-semialdehyde dehydrogenase
MEQQNYIDSLIRKAKEAQSIIGNYSQQQVDAIVKAIGKAIYYNAEMLAMEAVDETGFGNVESKTWKQQKTCIAAWVYLRDKVSVGVIEEDTINGIVTYAKPVGVIACLLPSTNPTSTLANNAMNAIKSGNAIILSPHPKAKKTSLHGVALVNEELKKLNAPENLIQIIQEPAMALSQELMSKADVVVATGGFGMIKAAYSSGRPSYGVGQGNVQALIAEDYTDYKTAADMIVMNRHYDNGIPCTCEQSVFFPGIREHEFLSAFISSGAYPVEDDDKIEKLTAVMFSETGAINVENVGLTAVKLAEKIGLDIPSNTRILLVKARGAGREHLLCKEKLNPVLQYYTYEKFESALEIAKTNLLMEGAGHTATVFTNNETTARLVGEKLPVGRVVVNQIGAAASGGSLINGLNPTMSLGCGSWGNNSISENLTYRHLMNVTKVAFPKKDFVFPSPEEVWNQVD